MTMKMEVIRSSEISVHIDKPAAFITTAERTSGPFFRSFFQIMKLG
jgi:hypothetical protein